MAIKQNQIFEDVKLIEDEYESIQTFIGVKLEPSWNCLDISGMNVNILYIPPDHFSSISIQTEGKDSSPFSRLTSIDSLPNPCLILFHLTIIITLIYQ